MKPISVYKRDGKWVVKVHLPHQNVVHTCLGFADAMKAMGLAHRVYIIHGYRGYHPATIKLQRTSTPTHQRSG